MFRAAVFLLTVLGVSQLQGQHGWEAKAVAGFLVPHHEDMQQMMSHINGVEVGREWKVDSGGTLDQRQHHPYCGIAVNYFNFGKPDLNGHAFTILNYYDAGIPLGKRSSFRGRFAVGIGYLNKDYNAVSNPGNRAIGSHINAFMQIFTYVQTPVAAHTSIQYGLGMSHFSNGNWSMPNLGINLPTLMLGIKHTRAGSAWLHPLQTYRVPNRIQWQFSLRAGKRQIGMDDPKNIVNYLADATIIYPHNPFRQWRVGLAGFYDRTYVYTKFQPLPNHIKTSEVLELALQCGHEYRVGHFGFVTDLGFYLFRPQRTKRMYYEGVGLKFYPTEQLAIISRLKAHLTSADYFEFGLAWNFTSRQMVNPGFLNGWKWIFTGFPTQRQPGGTPEF